jgi:hypothetical protein
MGKNNKKKNTEDFKKEILILMNNEYDVQSEYINSKTKVKMLHKTCGQIYDVKPNVFLNGRRCPVCYNNDRKIKKERLETLLGDDYIVLEDEFKANEKSRFYHKICKNEYLQLPGDILYHNSKCPICNSVNKKDNNYFDQRLKESLGPDYIRLGEYINNRTKVEVQHSCGYSFKTLPRNIYSGSGCPVCASSKNEQIINDILIKNNIFFEKQKSFEFNNRLKFDFYIENKILLEYDGEFHFLSRSMKDDSELKKQKLRDKEKNKYCKKNNIPLLRIPFWEQNRIDEIISFTLDFLKKPFSYTSFEKFKRTLKIQSFQKYKEQNKKQ